MPLSREDSHLHLISLLPDYFWTDQYSKSIIIRIALSFGGQRIVPAHVLGPLIPHGLELPVEVERDQGAYSAGQQVGADGDQTEAMA